MVIFHCYVSSPEGIFGPPLVSHLQRLRAFFKDSPRIPVVSSSWMFRQDGAATKRPQCQQGGDGSMWVCLKMLCTPLYPMVLLIILPFLNGYFIGNIKPTFSDKPIWQMWHLWTSVKWEELQWSPRYGNRHDMKNEANGTQWNTHEYTNGMETSPKDGDLSLWIPTVRTNRWV